MSTWEEEHKKYLQQWKDYNKFMQHDWVGGFCSKCHTSSDVNTYGPIYCPGENYLRTNAEIEADKPSSPVYEKYEPNCSCTMLVLMQRGCACGGK